MVARSGRRTRSSLTGPDARDAHMRLTGAEVTVLRMLVECDTNQEIADRLCISASTVRTHLRRLFTKLGARSRTGLVIAALREGLLDLSEL